jgi:hypothetical protein
MEAPPTPPADPQPVDATPYVGTYSCEVADLTVTQDADDRVWLDETPKGIAIEFGDVPTHTELVRLGVDTLIAREPDRGMHRVYAFLGTDAGPATYLHSGRALPRNAGSGATVR